MRRNAKRHSSFGLVTHWSPPHRNEDITFSLELQSNSLAHLGFKLCHRFLFLVTHLYIDIPHQMIAQIITHVHLLHLTILLLHLCEDFLQKAKLEQAIDKHSALIMTCITDMIHW